MGKLTVEVLGEFGEEQAAFLEKNFSSYNPDIKPRSNIAKLWRSTFSNPSELTDHHVFVAPMASLSLRPMSVYNWIRFQEGNLRTVTMDDETAQRFVNGFVTSGVSVEDVKTFCGDMQRILKRSKRLGNTRLQVRGGLMLVSIEIAGELIVDMPS